MADVRRDVVVCDERCGCSVPCPGGTFCRCGMGRDDSHSHSHHSTRSCGEQHCGCNPCSCPNTVPAASSCKCAQACSCASCRT